jgi:hypothetical protein
MDAQHSAAIAVIGEWAARLPELLDELTRSYTSSAHTLCNLTEAFKLVPSSSYTPTSLFSGLLVKVAYQIDNPTYLFLALVFVASFPLAKIGMIHLVGRLLSTSETARDIEKNDNSTPSPRIVLGDIFSRGFGLCLLFALIQMYVITSVFQKLLGESWAWTPFFMSCAWTLAILCAEFEAETTELMKRYKKGDEAHTRWRKPGLGKKRGRELPVLDNVVVHKVVPQVKKDLECGLVEGEALEWEIVEKEV